MKIEKLTLLRPVFINNVDVRVYTDTENSKPKKRWKFTPLGRRRGLAYGNRSLVFYFLLLLLCILIMQLYLLLNLHHLHNYKIINIDSINAAHKKSMKHMYNEDMFTEDPVEKVLNELKTLSKKKSVNQGEFYLSGNRSWRSLDMNIIQDVNNSVIYKVHNSTNLNLSSVEEAVRGEFEFTAMNKSEVIALAMRQHTHDGGEEDRDVQQPQKLALINKWGRAVKLQNSNIYIYKEGMGN